MWQGCGGLDGQYSGTTSTVLQPFGTAVRDTFSTTDGEFCYTYSRSLIDDSVKIQCKSDWLQGWIKALIPLAGNGTRTPTTNARFLVNSVDLS